MSAVEVLAKEAGTTIRAAITGWGQTLRLMTLLLAITGPVALTSSFIAMIIR